MTTQETIKKLQESIKNNEEIIRQGKYPPGPALRAIDNLRKRIALCEASITQIPVSGR